MSDGDGRIPEDDPGPGDFEARLTWGPGQVVVSQCALCRHAAPYDVHGVATCDAFLGGIPEDFLANRVDHRRHVDYDGGIRFEPRDDASSIALAMLDAFFRREAEASAD